MPGTVSRIHLISEAGADTETVETVEAVAGAGLRGDRYFEGGGTFADRDGCALTLIEQEALDAVERDHDISLAPGAHRRNITTDGIALNHLVGERFRVGDAVCVGTELCEPCSYLERQLGTQGVRVALVHRGGLRCRIVQGGAISVGDCVESAGRAGENDS